ncbi:MAG: DUF6785 family protein [Candidatus Brocadiia bacterium]
MQPTPVHPQASRGPGWRRGLTWRALLIGTALVVVESVCAPHAIWALASSEVTWSYMPVVAVVPFLVVVAGVNVVLKALDRRWALRPAELVVIFAMALASAGTPLFLVGFLLALMASPYYCASPENRWAELLHPYLPHWLFPSDRGGAMQVFFEGLPEGVSAPWGAWALPLAWWMALVLVFYFVCLCLVVVFRRQWVERERLVYPLLAVPRALIEDSDDARLVPKLFRSRLFWVGFGVPMGLIGWNVISYFEPGFPRIPLHGTWVSFGEGFPGINLILVFPTLGLAYFANSEVIFSVWFFYLLGVVQEGVYNRIGFSIGRSTVFCWSQAATGWQSFGAFVVMVLGAVWMARRHLAEVLARAVGRGGVDDSKEILSYRAAVVGFAGGTLFLAAWLWRSGMGLGLAVGFLAVVYIIYLGLARIVAQTGVSYVTPPLVAQPFLFFGVGSSALAPRELTALSCAYGWHGDVQTTFMVGAAQDAKLADSFRVHGRSLLPALGVSAVVGLVVSVVFIIGMAHGKGAANFGSWTFRVADGMGDRCFGMAVRQIAQGRGPDTGRLGCFGAGAGLMAALMVLKYRFAWWPLHPVGLAVASVWTIRRSALSLFLAWAVKTMLLRVGGVRLYQRAAPLFLGLVVGCFAGIALSQVVDAIWFYGQGHPIYNG